MENVESVVTNFIYILFPFLLYFVFAVWEKSYGAKRKNIVFDFFHFTSIYLLLKFGDFSNKWMLLLLLLPIIVSYKRGNLFSICFTTIMVIMGSMLIGNFSFWLLVIEQLIGLLIIYYIKINRHTFAVTNLLFLIKIFFTSIHMRELNLMNDDWFVYFLLAIIIYISIAGIVILADMYNNITDIYEAVEEDDQDKKIRESMFKITHEIKNPIAVCKGYLDMFDVKNYQHFIKYIPIIKQEINRTLMIMNDFLNMAKLNIVKDNFDLLVLVGDICDISKSLANSRGIKFVSNYPDEDVYLYGDYDRLKQVFINLVKNAIEAIGERDNGLINFGVNIKKYKIIFSIIDNGHGISKDNLKNIGISFFTTKKNGTGLGVKFSREIIDAHNGTINYKSNEGKGTTVTVIIPKIKKS